MKEYNKASIKNVNDKTVEGLQRLYVILIALALTTGVKVLLESIGVIDNNISVINKLIQFNAIILFVAFLLTLIVFYHGMNRHLEETFLLTDDIVNQRETLMIDMVVFIIESGLLVTMAYGITKPLLFFYAWSALLLIDIIWTLVVWRIHKKENPMWAINNAIFLIIAWASFMCFELIVWFIACIEILRNIVDYIINWRFYFPKVTIEEKV